MIAPRCTPSAIALLALASVFAATAAAQPYPSKPIRMIVPFTPGGGTDIVSRIVALKLTENWGKAVIVDNRPSAGGIIASEIVAKARPDGYTLGVITPTHAINPGLYAHLPFDPLKDFAAVVLMTRLQFIIVANPSFPPNSVKELIAYAKATGGRVNFGSTGIGSSSHLVGEMLKNMGSFEMTHVPYKGSAPAYTDLVSGQLQLLINNIVSTIPFVKAGKFKAIAVTGATRSPIAPDIPTVIESGLPGFDVSTWFGVVAPAKTPKPVIDKLNGEIARILKIPDVRERLLVQGAEPVGNTPEEFDRMIRFELKRCAELIKLAGIQQGMVPR